MQRPDAPAAPGYERLRESGIRAIAALWPHRHDYASARSAIRDVVFGLRQARYGR
jgi:hypothetical protein